MKSFVFTVIMLFFGTAAHSADPGYCKDLYSVTCAPGASKDPWGITSNNLDELEVDKAILDQKADITAKFRAVIDDKAHPYFRTLARSVLGFAKSPECQFDDDNRNECDRKISEGLFKLAAAKISSRSDFSFSVNASLDELNKVTENTAFRGVSRSLESKLREKFNAGNQEEKLEKELFPNVRGKLVKLIERMPIDQAKQRFAIEKVKSITYGGTECALINKEWDTVTLDRSMVSNAFYLVQRNDFHVCGGLLGTSSEFTLAFVMGHELAHSIDPCQLQTEPSQLGMTSARHSIGEMTKEYYLPALMTCLRDEKSIGADRELERRWDALMRLIFGQDKALCKDDRIYEAVADWFGTEIVAEMAQEKGLSRAEALKAFSNIFKFTCGGVRPNTDVHSAPKDRVNRLILQNPKVRGMLGCGPSDSSVGYCDGKNEKPRIGVASEVLTVEGKNEGASK